MHQIDELVPAGLTDLPLDDVVAAVLLIVFGIQTLQVCVRVCVTVRVCDRVLCVCVTVCDRV